MYQEQCCRAGLGFDWDAAIAGVAPTPGPAAPSTTAQYSEPTWWEGPLSQVSQAAADWVSSEVSGVPTYGGTPAYPVGTPGYQFYAAPDPALVEASAAPKVPWLVYGALAIGAAKLAGLW